MSWSKKVTVNYHFLEATDDEYFVNFQNNMNTLLVSGDVSGSFESGANHFVWKLNSKDDIADTETFFISLVKESVSKQVWFNEGGEIAAIPVPSGSLGELYYAYINPARKLMLSFSAGGGVAAGSFKKFLTEFSTDGGLKTTPMFENNIHKRTLLWDFYKKFTTSITFPTGDDISEFSLTNEGKLLGIIDELGGLKIDVSVSAPKQKQVLNAAQVRDITKSLISNDFCTKLSLKGADFETESVEEFDLKNAQIKYTETVEVMGSFISLDEAKGVLRRAFNDRVEEILNGGCFNE